MATIEVTLGLSKDLLRQVRDKQGNAFAPTVNPSPFLATDVLACSVWPGGSLAAVATPSVAWADATIATFLLSFAPSDTSGLAAGIYHYRVTATRSGKTGPIDEGTLEVLASPGSGTLELAFVTPADLIFYCPWIEDLEAWNDLYGFSGQRVKATNDLISELVGLAKPLGISAIPFSPDGSSYFLPGYSWDAPSRWLREQLIPLVPGTSVPIAGLTYRRNSTPNYIDPTLSTALLLYQEIKEIVAKRALSYIFKAQVGANTERAWKDLKAEFAGDARRMFLLTRFQLDYGTPQTGNGYSIIDGGNSSFR